MNFWGAERGPWTNRLGFGSDADPLPYFAPNFSPPKCTLNETAIVYFYSPAAVLVSAEVYGFYQLLSIWTCNAANIHSASP